MTFSPRQFSNAVLRWFDQHGRKNLPWQHNKTPYRVWISEIMLQQTQVTTVIPYFENFMRRFPDLKTLAKASVDDVLHAWAGLGYYSRARNLHKAAQMVLKEFAGKFPDNLEDLMTLPGIGRSTAGAILSIAFGQRATILDGNVKRVLARFLAVREPLSNRNTEAALWAAAEDMTPTKRSADYTQAIMDLGATHCTLRQPQCPQCPLAAHCQGYAEGIAALLPIKKATKVIPTREATFIILEQDSKILLEKRPPYGIWGGLWSLPEISGKPNHKAIREYCNEVLRYRPKSLEILKPFRHTFSHYHLEIHPVVVKTLPTAKIMADDRQIWYNLKQPKAVGLPKPIQTIVRNLA